MGDRNQPVDDAHGKSTWEQVADTTATAAAVVRDKLENASSRHNTPDGNVALGSASSPYDNHDTTARDRDHPTVSDDARENWHNAKVHAGQAVDEAGDALVQTAKDTSIAGQQLAQKGSDKLRQGYDSAAESAQQTSNQVKGSAQSTWDSLRKRSKELSAQGQELVQETEERAGQTVGALQDSAKQAYNSAEAEAQDAWEAVRHNSQRLVESGKENIAAAESEAQDAWEAVRYKSQRLVESGKENANEAADKARDKYEEGRGRVAEKADELGDRAASTAEQGREAAEDAKHRGKAWYRDTKEDVRQSADRAGDKLRGTADEGRRYLDETAEKGRHTAERVQHRGSELYQDAKHNAKEGAGQLAGIVEDTKEQGREQVERGRHYADDKAHQAKVKAEEAEHKGKEWYRDAKHEAQEKADRAAARSREVADEAKHRAKEVDQASKDAMRTFIQAMGSVPPFTWLERATREEPASSPYSHKHRQDSPERQASGLAHSVSDATHNVLHRAERGISDTKDAVVHSTQRWSEKATSSSGKDAHSDSPASADGKDELDRVVEKTEAETRGAFHSVGRALTSPWRAFDRFNHRNAERMHTGSQQDTVLASGRIPSNTAAVQGRDLK